jgi:Spy/CpxP family protein refolding chaperone
MLKILSAIGFASALVLAPVVALADDAAAPDAAAAAPMAHHHHHHHHHHHRGHPIKHDTSHPGDAPAGDAPK